MGLIEKQNLVHSLSPPFDTTLTDLLIDEFVSMEQRYIQRDWEPAELDGGQFCEILARVLYHVDSGTLNVRKSFDDCLKWIEDDKVSHSITPRRAALHIAKVLRTVYKFRSQRGAVHISPSYSPNHMDAKLVIESVRWCMNECLRIFWQGDREKVAKAIRELLQFDVPCIGVFEDVLMVQRTDLSAEEEILVLLHYAGESGFSRTELGKNSMASQSTVTRALKKLAGQSCRQVVQLSNRAYRLTDLGSRRIRMELAEKLMLQ